LQFRSFTQVKLTEIWNNWYSDRSGYERYCTMGR